MSTIELASTSTMTSLVARMGAVEDVASWEGVGGPIYANESTGRAAVANGVMFLAIATLTTNAIDIWRRDSAGASTLMRTVPATSAITDQGTVLTNASVQARIGGALGNTAPGDFSVLTYVVGGVNLSNALARWAKAYDAGATNDDITVVTGSIVQGIVIEGAVLNSVTAATVRGRIWRRPLSSANINLKPGQVDDVIVADSGAVAPPADWPNMSGATARALAVLPMPAVEILAGYRYFADIEWRNGSNVLLATRIAYKQTTTVAQPLAGFYYATTGASDWTSQNSSRPITLGFATRGVKNIATIEATANAGRGKLPANVATSLLTDMERLLIEENGAWDKVKRPGVATTSNGLSLLFGDAAWTPGVGRGQYGVDFGPKTALGSLVDLSVIGWDPVNKRILYNNATIGNSLEGFVLQGFKSMDGFIDISQPYMNIVLRDFYLENATTVLNGISVNATMPARVIIEDGYIGGFDNRGVTGLSNGELRRCQLDLNGADCFGSIAPNRADSFVLVEQCLMRRPAHTSIAGGGAHGDIMQTPAGKRMSFLANTFYYPGTGSTYDEGVIGSTNVERWESCAAGGGDYSDQIYMIGNLVIGGGYSVSLPISGNNTSHRDHIRLGNRYAPAGTGYRLYQDLLIDNATGTTSTFHRNIAIFDEFRTDGVPFSVTLGNTYPAYATYSARTEASWKAIAGNNNPYRYAEERWGIFGFDRANMNPKTREMLHRYGRATGREILKWNGDINPAYNLGNLKV